MSLGVRSIFPTRNVLVCQSLFYKRIFNYIQENLIEFWLSVEIAEVALREIGDSMDYEREERWRRVRDFLGGFFKELLGFSG